MDSMIADLANWATSEKKLPSLKRGPHTIKILAYIERRYAPHRDEDVEEALMPNVPKGYTLDCTLMLMYGSGEDHFETLPIHVGDGKDYPSFEEAQAMALYEIGVLVEPIPESELPEFPRTGNVYVRVGRMVREFVESGRSREQIEADRDLDYPVEGWRTGGDIHIGKKKPEGKPN